MCGSVAQLLPLHFAASAPCGGSILRVLKPGGDGDGRMQSPGSAWTPGDSGLYILCRTVSSGPQLLLGSTHHLRLSIHIVPLYVARWQRLKVSLNHTDWSGKCALIIPDEFITHAAVLQPRAHGCRQQHHSLYEWIEVYVLCMVLFESMKIVPVIFLMWLCALLLLLIEPLSFQRHTHCFKSIMDIQETIQKLLFFTKENRNLFKTKYPGEKCTYAPLKLYPEIMELYIIQV